MAMNGDGRVPLASSGYKKKCSKCNTSNKSQYYKIKAILGFLVTKSLSKFSLASHFRITFRFVFDLILLGKSRGRFLTDNTGIGDLFCKVCSKLPKIKSFRVVSLRVLITIRAIDFFLVYSRSASTASGILGLQYIT